MACDALVHLPGPLQAPHQCSITTVASPAFAGLSCFAAAATTATSAFRFLPREAMAPGALPEPCLGANRGRANTTPSSNHRPGSQPPGQSVSLAAQNVARRTRGLGGGLPGHNHSSRGRRGGCAPWGTTTLPVAGGRELQEAPDRITRACGRARTRQLCNKPGFTQAFLQASVGLNSLAHDIQTPPPLPGNRGPIPNQTHSLIRRGQYSGIQVTRLP